MILLRRLGTPLLALAFALLCPVTGAQARDPAPVAKTQKAEPALWKVSDADTTIWLFGTIHILPPGIDWYNRKVARALESADTLVTEIVTDDHSATAQLMAQIALADPPQNLREALSPQQRTAYEQTLAALHIPPDAFDANDPWYAAVLLSTVPLMQDGFGAVNGAESLLVDRAKARGIAHIGLETTEYQLGLFDALPRQVQLEYLGEVLESFPEIRDKVRAMVHAWKGGKADQLARLMNEDESDPLLMKVLLTDRNKAWAKWIEERLEQPGTVFIAVGAGHLAGKDSVQAQLAADRIEARRVQ